MSDQVVVTFFPSPSSYTGEDVVEISAHGSPVILSSILRRAIDAGARLAEPGEFTLRAFLNGKLDLIQAEAVADLIDAVTPLQARTAFDQLEGTLTGVIRGIESDLFEVIAKLEASLDFPDEGYHFMAPSEARGSLASVIDRCLPLHVGIMGPAKPLAELGIARRADAHDAARSHRAQWDGAARTRATRDRATVDCPHGRRERCLAHGV